MLFPKEILNQTSHNLSFRHTVKSQILYSTTLCFVAVIFATLPFIKADVSVQSSGIIRTTAEKQILKAPISGIISELSIKENNPVRKGELLIAVEAKSIEKNIELNEHRQQLVSNYIEDLNTLKSGIVNGVELSLITPLYQSEWASFEQEKTDLELSIHNKELEYDRKKHLFEKAVISESELQQITFELETEKKRIELLLKSKLNSWQQELDSFEQELLELKNEFSQLIEEKERHYLYAPINGVIQNVVGLSEGSLIYTNEHIAEISTNTSLIAELYVSTRDIGLLKKGMPARFQVDAFDYNQWGSLEGKISEISNDVVVIQKQPVFLVRCILESDYLMLSNGYKGNLKKGMTLQGRFIVTERSLFQLLYDNIDDWLNPT